MNVEEAMTTEVACCHHEDHDGRAAQLLWEADCGALPVLDDAGRVVGLVTDRDLCMAAYTRGEPLGDLRVADAMSREVHACRAKDSLTEALEIMRREKVRRLPVVDAEQRPLGILSLCDVVRVATQTGEKRGRKSLTEVLLSTMKAIGEPWEGPPPEPRLREGEILPASKERALTAART